MAEEILSNDELLDSNEVLGNDSEPKPGSGKDLLKKAVKKGSITNDYVLGKSYLLDEQKGKKVMGDAFLPYKPKFASLYTEAQKNYELRLAKKKAEDQGFWGEAGGAIAQALAEIVGGTVEGAGYLLDFKSMGDGTFGEGNWFSYLGTALKDWTREVAPIHVDPEVQGTFSPASREWWFSNVPSIASALSILIPVAGWARGVGMVGKGVGMGVKAARAAKAAKLAKAGKKATGLGGLNGIDDAVRAGMAYQDKFSKIWNAVAKNRTLNAVHQGIVSRHIESSMEASGVYQEVYEQVLAETGNEAEAKYAASDAAAFSYKGNSVLVFQDIPQYILLGRGLKATRAFNGRAQMVAAGKSGTKGTMKSAGRYMSDMASEFGEEAWQFVVGEEAIHFGNVMGGIAEDSNFSSRFGEYLEDGEFWTAGFFGAIGAGVMQAAKPIYDKIKGKSAVDSRIKELEDRGARFAYHNKKIRAAAESGLPDIYEQAMLDASSDMAVTAAREGNLDHYRQELETLKTADAETRKKMGVDETFVENIDRLINDANTVEQLWNANVNRFDPSILPYVVQSKFAISKLDKDRGKLISKINENRNGVYRYNELSAEGRIVFDAKLNITAAERGVEHAKKLLNDKSRKLTKEQKENIQEYIDKQEKRIAKDRTAISAVEADDSIALPDSDKDILKLLDNEALIGEAVSNIEKLSWQDQLIDAHIKRLNSLTNREIIGLAAKNKANLDKGRKDFRRVQDLYTKIYKGAKEEILGKRKTIGVDEEGKPIKEKSDDWKDKEGSPEGTSDFELTRRYEVELTPKEKQAAIDEAKEILARTTDEQDKENIAKMIEKMEEVVNDGISRFQQQEKRKLKAIRDAQARALKKIKQLEAQAKRKETLTIKNEIALAYDQYEMIDHAYDDVPLGDLFIDDSDVLSVFYRGEKGTLFKNDLGEAVFKSSSSGEEIIISSSGNLEWNKLFYRRTASDLNLGIVKDSYYPIDIEFYDDRPIIWIGDNEFDYSGNFPQESIKYDKAGNLKSVTLINKNTGNPIEITGEILMYEIADLLLVYQLALEEFLYTTEIAPDGTTRQIPGTFVVNGIEYQVDYNIKDPSKSKVFSVLRIDDEWVADKEMLLARRDYVINEVSKQFTEQLTADIEGYVVDGVVFDPRIQLERETVREYVKRGEGPLTKKSGETKDEFAERTADTKYEIKGHNKWILNKQNKPRKDEETDSKDIPPQPPAGPETQKETDGTESTGASKGDPQTEDEIVNQIPDGDLPTSELELIAINKALQELEPKASQLTEDLKNAQSIEDLQRLLLKKTEELAGTTNVDPAVAAAEAVPPSPIYRKGKSTSTGVKVIKRSSIKAPEELGLTAAAEAKAAAKPKKTRLSAEEVSNIENEIKRIKNFIKKVETEFDTIKDEAVKAKLAAKKSTVLVDEDVEIGDAAIETKRNTLKEKAKKRIDRQLKKITEAENNESLDELGLAKVIFGAIAEIQTNLYVYEQDPLSIEGSFAEEKEFIEQQLKALEAEGYEMPTLLGTTSTVGQNLDEIKVLNPLALDEESPIQKKVVTQVREPKILKDGQEIQKGKVYVEVRRKSKEELQETLADVKRNKEVLENIGQPTSKEDVDIETLEKALKEVPTKKEDTKPPPPKQPEPSFELESTEPAADSRKSKFTQQTPGNVDGSIETKTFSYQKKKNSSGAYYLVFDENENPITRDKDFGISFNDDLLANPNLINENTKVYVRPFETPYFRNEIANNPGRNPSNDYMEIPMILYIEHEGNKVAVGILKAANTTEEEQQIRNAIFQNWTKTNKEGYTVANLVPTDEDVFINFTGGQNLRNVRDDQNKPVLKSVAERWTSAWQDDGEGNIEFYTDEDVELKFGYVNKPLEGEPQLIIPQEGTSNLSMEAKVLRPERSEAGQIYGVILNGNGQYIFPKLSTSQISEKAAKVISDILSQKAVSKEDVDAIQEIIFAEYENSDIIEAIASLTNVPDNRNIDPIIKIAWNHNKRNAYIQFIHNDKVYSVDVNDLKDDVPASLRRKKIVVKENTAANKKEQSLSVENIEAEEIYNELGVHPLVIINEIIKRKKYNVRRESLNDFTEEYTSRVTGQVYKNYNDYISGREDQNGNPNNEINNKRAILQTDIQPSSEGNYFYDLQLQITIKKEEVQEEDAEVKEEDRMPDDLEESEDKYDKFAKGENLFGLGEDPSENPSGTIGGIPSMSPRGRFNMFLNKFNIQLSGFSSIRPGKVDPVTVKQFKNEAKIFGLEGRVSTNGSLYLYDPSTKKALVKDNSPSNNPNFKLKLSRVKPIKTDYPYQTTRTRTGRTIFQLGITPIEWATTPVKEKENIINCN